MKDIFGIILVFLLGFFTCMMLTFIYKDIEQPIRIGEVSIVNPPNSPGDWIKESQISIYENAVVLHIEGASLSRYAATGSMKPVLDIGSNGIRIVPENPEQIEIGDIITFEKNGELIIHRVIEKGTDEEGIYFITKGDNNNVTDGKVRFEEIKYVTIGILY